MKVYVVESVYVLKNPEIEVDRKFINNAEQRILRIGGEKGIYFHSSVIKNESWKIYVIYQNCRRIYRKCVHIVELHVVRKLWTVIKFMIDQKYYELQNINRCI